MTHFDALNRAQDDLARLLPGFLAAHRRLLDADAALPGAAAYDANGSTSGPGTSPTERLALTTDPTEKQRRQLDASVKAIAFHTRMLDLIVTEWTPHAPTARDRAQVERANAPDDGCEHHATAGIYEHATHTGTVAGNLTVPMRLCEFCYRETYRKGVLPRGEVLVDRHHKGKDPMVPA